MAEAPLTLSFSEQHPSSIKFDKIIATALAAWLLFAMFFGPLYMAIGGAGAMFATLPWIVWGAYFAYRFTKRYSTTVTLEGDRLTIHRVSIAPIFSKGPTTYQLGSRTTAAMDSSSGWWLPTELPFMDGDNPQYFTDVALSTTDEHGVTRHVLVSRDRATKDVMMARREAIEQMLKGKQPPRA